MNTNADGLPAEDRPVKHHDEAVRPLNFGDEAKKTQEHNAEALNGAPQDPEKQQQPAVDEKKGDNDGEQEKKDSGPAGGYDATPIPYKPGGYTIKMTIHRASNLPMADLNSLSSDPYVLAEIKADQPATRHKEDPPLRTRTRTIRRSTDPEWNAEWIVANAPSSGFKIKMRVYDEDPADKDDRLGNVHIHVPSINESWPGIKEKSYGIEKRSGSKRAYAIRAVATCFRVAKHMHGDLWLSVELLGKTPEDGQNGRMYTIGPQWWTRHFSPLLGRLANTHAPDEEKEAQQQQENGNSNEKQQAKRYDFQANQMQLKGPVPAELYHRYVEIKFKSWIKGMFTASGIQGYVLSKALHHQHSRVYNFDRSTQWGHFGPNPGEEVTHHFLDLVHWDQGARIFTYVLTLDALWRFTETGKEFGVDMLSKHTMHSDVSIYIAYSGEFFIRRLKHPRRPPPPEPTEAASQDHPPAHGDNPTHPPEDIDGGPPKEDGPRDPAHYELVIDNDSGTYRPNAKLLPLLKSFLAANLPGLHIMTLDCNGDADKMNKMKSEQRERKKKEGDHIIYRQGSRGSSISSSDESELDDIEAGLRENSAGAATELNPLGQYAKDRKQQQTAKWNKVKRDYGGKSRDGVPVSSSGAGDTSAGAEAAESRAG